MHPFQRFRASKQGDRKKRLRRRRRQPHSKRLGGELLEDRRLLASLTVNQPLDVTAPDGLLSLREAIVAVNTGVVSCADVPGQFGCVLPTPPPQVALPGSSHDILLPAIPSGLVLGQGVLSITTSDTVRVRGPGSNRLTITSSPSSVFEIGSGADVSIEGLTLSGSGGTGDGGAIRSSAFRLTIDDVVFASNITSGKGGAIYSDGNHLSINDSTFTSNEAEDGGAIYVSGTSLDISASTSLNDNKSSSNGGAIYLNQAGATIAGSLLQNRALQHGGAIYADRGSLTTDFAFINNNQADVDGGGIYLTGTTAMIVGSDGGGGSIAENAALHDGGGVFVAGGDVEIVGLAIDNNTANRDGGGVSISGGTVELRDVELANNSAAERGGGLAVGFDSSSSLLPPELNLTGTTAIGFNSADWGGGVDISDGASLTLESTASVHDNEAQYNGGGVYAQDAETLLRGNVTGNSALNFGGGVYLARGASLFENATVTDNTAKSGGGLYANMLSDGDTATHELAIVDTTFHQNAAASSNAARVGGGGVHLQNTGDVLIRRTTISENQGQDGGGLLLENTGGTVLVDRVSLTANQATDGGALALYADQDATTTLIQTTVSGNQVNSHGGGLYVASGVLQLRHDTITDNTAAIDSSVVGGGGGLWVAAGADAQLDHTIVAGNVDAGGAAPEVGGAIDAEYSLIGSEQGAAISPGAGNLVGSETSPIDARLVALGDHGGPTPTHIPRLSSPAVNAGDPSFSNADPTLQYDQRGEPFQRVVAGRIDIGATELPLIDVKPKVDYLVDESDDDFGAGDLSLREAILLANFLPEPNEIEFDSSLAGGTVILQLGELVITDHVTVRGLAAGRLTIDAKLQSRALNVDDGDAANSIDVELIGIDVIGGAANAPDPDGGAIRSRENLTLRQVAIRSSGADGRGGGVAALDGAFTAIDSTFEGNVALGDGGGIFSLVATQIETSTVSGNTALGNGGGIAGDMLSLLSSTVSGNESQLAGGGIYVGASEATIAHSTITQNMAQASGGGVFADSTVALDHTIVAGNGGDLAPDDLAQTTLGSFETTYSLIGSDKGATIANLGGSLIGSYASPLDPRLGPLADNGGSTLTHALDPDSPAVDGGNESIALPPPADQRGFMRVREPAIDVGAVEYQGNLLVVDTQVDIVDGDTESIAALLNSRGGDSKISLREAILATNNTPGEDRIAFDAAVDQKPILLSIVGAGEDQAAAGDLDIADDVVILGNGHANTTVDASDLGDRLFHILPNVVVRMEGLTFRDGDAGADDGGGVFVDSAALTVIDSRFAFNAAANGGAVAVLADAANASADLVDTHLAANTADVQGGGIYVFAGSSSVSATVTLQGSSIFDNQAQAGAGAASTASAGAKALLNVQDSTLSGNEAQAPDGRGGGILNLAVAAGGSSSLANLKVSNSTISGNSSASDGGGIYNAAVAADDLAILEMRNVTVADNTATDSGGGIFNTLHGLISRLHNTIVADNQSSLGGADLTNQATLANATHNLIQDPLGHGLQNGVNGNLVGVAAHLVPLDDNGGDTQTHAVLVLSPAIDGGDVNQAEDVQGDPLTVDQRGEDRVAGGSVDIGAFESLANDYGDAPDPSPGFGAGDYQTLAVHDGPAHVITPNLFLGSAIDGEAGLRQSAAANGDDNNVLDDEDGVDNPINQLTIRPGHASEVVVTVTNTTGAEATLAGWIDYNGDGVFHSSERATAIVADGSLGSTVTLTFPEAPADLAWQTYARFRISTDLDFASDPQATGLLGDGEVEDYRAGRAFRIWDGEAGDNQWLSPTNWASLRADGSIVNINAVPNEFDDVYIPDAFASETIVLSTTGNEPFWIRSIQSAAPLLITQKGRLDITADSSVAGLTLDALPGAYGTTLQSRTGVPKLVVQGDFDFQRGDVTRINMQVDGDLTMTTANTKSFTYGSLKLHGDNSVWTEGPLRIDGATLSNYGTLTMLSSDEILERGGFFSPDGKLHNRSGATLIHDAEATGGQGKVLHAIIENDGSLEVRRGALEAGNCCSTIVNSGSFLVQSDAELIINGRHTYDAASQINVKDEGALTFASASHTIAGGFDVSGAVNVVESTVAVQPDLTLPQLFFDGNSLVGPGAITVTERLDWVRGDLTSIHLSSNGVAVLGDSSEGGILSFSSGGQFTNRGDATWAGRVISFQSGVLRNEGAFEVVSDAGITRSVFGFGRIDNLGTWTKFGPAGSTSTATRNVRFVNYSEFSLVDTKVSYHEFRQKDGQLRLQGSTLAVTGGDLLHSGGAIEGAGVIDTNLGQTAGQLRPGSPIGSLEITGNYLQNGGALEMEVGGVVAGSEHDQLIVGGTGTLAGELDVALTNNYQPTGGESFLLVAGETSGTFSSVNLPTPPADVAWKVVYGSVLLDAIDIAPLEANAGGPYSLVEGIDAALSGSATGAEGNITFEWDLDYDGGTFDVDATGGNPRVSFPDDLAQRTIAVRVSDAGSGETAIATTTLEVANAPPILEAVAFQQLSDVSGESPDITADGGRVVYRSADDELALYDGTNETVLATGPGTSGALISGDGSRIMYQRTTTSGILPVTTTSIRLWQDGSSDPVLAPGGLIASSAASATGDLLVYADVVQYNSPLESFSQIVLADIEDPQNVTRIEITDILPEDIDNGWTSTAPDISAVGNVVVFASNKDLTGGNSDHNFELFAYDIAAETLAQLTDTSGFENTAPSIRGDGAEVIFRSNADFTGANADGSAELFLIDTASGQVVRQLTDTSGAGLGDAQPQLSDDGSRAVFLSRSDLVGHNADGNVEVFLLDVAASQLVQITDTVGTSSARAALSADGRRLVFQSNADLTGQNPLAQTQVFVADVSTVVFEYEGEAQIDGRIVDPGLLDSHKVEIDWGDGSQKTVLDRASTERHFAAAHQYPLNLSDQPVDFSIDLTVTDDDGGVGSLQLTFTQPGNQPPHVIDAIEDQVVSEFSADLSFDLSTVFDDPDLPRGDAMDYAVQVSPSGIVTAQIVDATLTLSFDPGKTGVVDVTVRARDIPGALAEDVFSVTVQPLIADPGGPYSLVEGTPTALDGEATGAVGTEVYEWDLHYDGSTFDVDATGSEPVVSFPDDLPERVIALRVRDSVSGQGVISTTTLQVLNAAPIVEPATFEQLSGVPGAFPTISDDGSQIVFRSADDELVLYDEPDATVLATLAKMVQPVVSGDGSRILYLQDTTSPVPGLASRLLRLWQPGTPAAASHPIVGGGGLELGVVSADGAWRVYTSATSSGPVVQPVRQIVLANVSDPLNLATFELTQATTEDLIEGRTSIEPDISAAGEIVVFASNQDLTGENADHNFELFTYEIATATLSQLTDTFNAANRAASIRGDGAELVFRSTTDFTGENPDGNAELFLRNVADGQVRQLTDTSDARLADVRPQLSVDGSRVVFSTTADLVGRNPDGNAEIFLLEVATSEILQVTETVGASNVQPVLDADGSRIAFQSDADLTGNGAAGQAFVFAADVTETAPTWTIESRDVELAGSFRDLGLLDAHTVDITWGDGATDTRLTPNVGERQYAAVHRYPRNLTSSPVPYTIEVTVTDDDQGVGSLQLTHLEPPGNRLPTVLNPIADLQVDEDAADVAVDISNVFSDPDIPDGDSLSLSLPSGGNSNPGLVSATLDNGELTLSFLGDQFGTAHITLRATDLNGLSVDDTFEVLVHPVNDAPSFEPGDDVHALGDDNAVTVPAWATGILPGPSNEAAQSVEFQILNISDPSIFSTLPVIAVDGTLSFTPASVATVSAATITVELVDDGGVERGGADRTSPQDFEIHLYPPIVTTLADENDARLGQGDGESLREILAAANATPGNTTIGFLPELSGEMQLAGGSLSVLDDVVIDVAEDASISVLGGSGIRVFYVDQGVNATIRDLTIAGGRIAGSGAGINNAGSLSLERVTVRENETTLFNAGAGIANLSTGSLSIVASTISGNRSAGGGGGIKNSGTLDIVNSTISGNSARDQGAGIDNQGGSVHLVNVTITNNRADSDSDGSGLGGGIATTNSDFTAHNTIVAGNFRGTATANSEIAGTLDPASSHNLIGTLGLLGDHGGLSGVNGNLFRPLDVALGMLTDNGGPTQTHALRIGSPALDAGDSNQAVAANLGEDQRGFARFAETFRPGAIVDIGAFEAHRPELLEALPDLAVDEGDPPIVQNLAATFVDPDGQLGELTLSVAGNTNSTLVEAQLDGDELTLLLRQYYNGVATITVRATDPDGHFVEDTFDVTVQAVNDAPSFTKGSDVYLLGDSNAVTLPGWATSISAGPNEETQTLAFQVVDVSDPDLFEDLPTLSPDGTLQYTPVSLEERANATVTVQLVDDGGTVYGGDDTSDPQSFVINLFPPLVTTLEDQNDSRLGLNSGESLREILEAANAVEGSTTIRFDRQILDASGGISTIELEHGALHILDDIVLQAVDSTNVVRFAVSGQNSSRVFEIGDGVAAQLENVRVVNGRVDSDGGGVLNRGELTLRSVLVDRNWARNGSGGGIFNAAGATLQLIDSAFHSNRSVQTSSAPPDVETNGGAIANHGTLFFSTTQPVVAFTYTDTSALFEGFTDNDSDGRGGAIFNGPAANVHLVNATVTGNQAEGDGGAIYNSASANLVVEMADFRANSANQGGAIYSDGVLELTDSIVGRYDPADQTPFEGPFPNSAAGSGGGIYSTGDLEVAGSTIGGNDSGASGGGIFSLGAGRIESSTIWDNEATADGGGVFSGGDLVSTNTTISGNRAGDGGGGIYNALGATASLTHLTIVENIADLNNETDDYAGGGLATFLPDVVLYNSIIAGNISADQDNTPSSFDPLTDNVLGDLDPSSSHNAVQVTVVGAGGTVNSGGLNEDLNNQLLTRYRRLRLAELAENGGPTKTHALLSTSLALDAGDINRSIIANLQKDQRGADRWQDGGSGVAQVDVGAFEATWAHRTHIVDTIEDDGDGLSFGEAMQRADDSVGPDTIQFDLPAGATIVESFSFHDSYDPLSIVGPGADALTLEPPAPEANNSIGWNTNSSNPSYFGSQPVVTIDKLTFRGGGLTNWGTLTLQDAVVTEGRGILNEDAASLNILGSTISHNVSEEGGGILNRGQLFVANSTISRNTAEDGVGGGLFVDVGGTADLVNSTIAENVASDEGGGVFAGQETVRLWNTIAFDNLSLATPANDISGDVEAKYSLIGDTNGSTFTSDSIENVIKVTSVLGPLAYNGGPTPTHSLLLNSSARDNGLKDLAIGLENDQLDVDQRGVGFPRVVGSQVDIGAFEAGPGPSIANLIDDEEMLEDGAKRDVDLSNVFHTDAGNLTLSVSGNSNPGLIEASLDKNTLTLTPLPDQFGSAAIVIRATDEDGAFVEDEFEVHVRPVNDLPTFSLPVDFYVEENSPVTHDPNVVMDLTTGPVNESGQSLVFEVLENTNPQLFATPPALNDEGELTIDLAPDQAGIATLTVRLMDDGGTANGGEDTTTPQSMTIHVIPEQLVVTTAADEDDGNLGLGAGDSLREVIQAANRGAAHNTIQFSPEIGSVIAVASGGLRITRDVTILGPGAGQLSIGDDPDARILTIGSGSADVLISGVTIRGGKVGIVNSGHLQLDDVVVTENHGEGGISSSNSLEIRRSVISRNSSFRGAGIHAQRDVRIVDSQITGNVAANAGGGLFLFADADVPLFQGRVEIISSTIDNNSAAYVGGGIANGVKVGPPAGSRFGGEVEVVNSTISDNAAGEAGGGIWNAETGWFSATNSTIAGNTATDLDDVYRNGGGIWNQGDATLRNTVIAYNTLGDGAPDDVYGSVVADYSLIGNLGGGAIVGSSAGTLVDVDPLLEPLQENGGPTPTRALSPGSPARNAGSSALVQDPSAPIPTDQRGFSRLEEGQVDMGAYETQEAPVVRQPLADTVMNEDDSDLVIDLSEAFRSERGRLLSLSAAGNTNEQLVDAALVGSELTLSLAPDQFGAATLTVRATDEDGFFVEDEFDLTVQPVNDRPILTVTRPEIFVSPAAGLVAVEDWAAGLAGPSNEDSQSLEFELVSVSDPALFAIPPTVAPDGTVTFAAADAPDYVSADVVVVLRDDGGTERGGIDVSTTQTLRVTIVPATLTVTTALDEDDDAFNSGSGNSLREVLELTELAAGANTIQFDLPAESVIDLISELPWITEDLTIAGPGADQLTVGFVDSRVFSILGYSATVEISGLTISDGELGIANQGNLTVRDAVIRNHVDRTDANFWSGGGILSSGALTVRDSIIHDNATQADGGGISAHDLLLENSEVFANSAVAGGGIAANGDVLIVDSRLEGNTVADTGGGVYVIQGTLEIANTAISNNSAGGNGGGIATIDARTTLVDSTLHGNTASGDGGGLYVDANGRHVVVGSTVDNNLADSGGGIAFRRGLLVVSNSTISTNSASNRGGGLLLDRDASTNSQVTNSTITNNRARNEGDRPLPGGGIALDSGLSLLLRNSIVAENYSGSGTEGSEIGGGLGSGSSFNLIGTSSGSPDSGFHGGAGLFVPDGQYVGLGGLENNGGSTRTHALLVGTPALNAGANSFALDPDGNPLTTDQRSGGYDRISDSVVDIGAFEVNDQDQDGIDESIENAGPNGGDGNGDGIPDREQAHVVSFPNAVNSQYMTMVAPVETSFRDVAALVQPGGGVTPADSAEFPLGVFAFRLEGLAPRSAAVVELVPETMASWNTYQKFGPESDNATPHEYAFSFDGETGAQFTDDRILLHFVDGGRGDSDLAANGSIVDPGGPAFNPAPVVSPPAGPAAAVPQQPVSYTAAFTDLGNEPHSATIFWGDGASQAGVVNQAGGAGTVSGSHIYTEPGEYTVRIEVTDSFGNVSAVQKQVTVQQLLLTDDPENPGRMILSVGGTPGDDDLSFRPRRRGSQIEVKLNGQSLGRFPSQELSRIVAFGGEGNDRIAARGLLALPVEFHGGRGADTIRGGLGDDLIYGGEGDDVIRAGLGDDIVVGGAGNDSVFGGWGRDVLIGGLGVDRLYGGLTGGDLLIGGATVHDHHDEALRAIMAEWSSNQSFNVRTSNLRNGGGLNDAYTLCADTIIADGAADHLVASLFGRDWIWAEEIDEVMAGFFDRVERDDT